MDGYGFAGGHILIFDDQLFLESCFSKVHICGNYLDLYIVCLPKLKWFTVTKPTTNIQKDYLVSKVAQEVLCATLRTTHD